MVSIEPCVTKSASDRLSGYGAATARAVRRNRGSAGDGVGRRHVNAVLTDRRQQTLDGEIAAGPRGGRRERAAACGERRHGARGLAGRVVGDLLAGSADREVD